MNKKNCNGQNCSSNFSFLEAKQIFNQSIFLSFSPGAKAKKMRGLKVFYWNNDCNKVLNGGSSRGSIEAVFPELSAEQRLPHFKAFMQRQLTTYMPDVVCLSESCKYTNAHGQLVDCIGQQKLFFEVLGFVVYTLPYFQNEPQGFNHLVAVRKGVELIALEPIWMTKSSQPGKNERCIASATLCKDGDDYVVNFCHMAMASGDRINSAQVISALPPKDGVEVFVGDFNTFHDDRGSEQIGEITASGLADVPLLWPDGSLVASTIAPFVYDPVIFNTGVPKDFLNRVEKLSPGESRKERITFYALNSEVKGSVLDHIFLRNGNVSNAQAIVSSVAPNTLTSLTDDAEIRTAVLTAAEHHTVPFASDHVLLSFTVHP
jgi:hypothetical protein